MKKKIWETSTRDELQNAGARFNSFGNDEDFYAILNGGQIFVKRFGDSYRQI
ncbi:MAG TPA: hypothetical protein VFF28_02605 [Candidatus Nanoarchaeia archaeon]|nr:hypothetical protein [Candidatus Nanoarchaeia archaeon]